MTVTLALPPFSVEKFFEGDYIKATEGLVLFILTQLFVIYSKAYRDIFKPEGRRRLALMIITLGACVLGYGIYLLASQTSAMAVAPASEQPSTELRHELEEAVRERAQATSALSASKQETDSANRRADSYEAALAVRKSVSDDDIKLAREASQYLKLKDALNKAQSAQRMIAQSEAAITEASAELDKISRQPLHTAGMSSAPSARLEEAKSQRDKSVNLLQTIDSTVFAKPVIESGKPPDDQAATLIEALSSAIVQSEGRLTQLRDGGLFLAPPN